MKKSLSTMNATLESLSGFLLLCVFLSSTLSFGASKHSNLVSTDPPAASLASAQTLFPSPALNSFHNQRAARDSSKENRVKHPVAPTGLASARFACLQGTQRQRLVGGDSSVVKPSFRHSPTLGRAPPLSA
jgi:hypothetical protein